MDGASIYELLDTEKVTFTRRRADGLADAAAISRGDRQETALSEEGGDRRLGVPARHHAEIPGQLRRRGDPRLGHDRDVAARHAGHAEAGICRAARATPRLDIQAEAGLSAFRRRDEGDRRRRQRAALGRQDLRAAEGARPGRRARLLWRRRSTSSSTKKAGSIPATSPIIDPSGYMQITDRAKDVIKSGGEWISTIDLENLAVGHPDVAEAAVIGVPHSRWDERPLLVVVRKPGREPTKTDILAFMNGKVAKWWMPDDVAFVGEIPHTATGKIQKSPCASNSGTIACRRIDGDGANFRLQAAAKRSLSRLHWGGGDAQDNGNSRATDVERGRLVAAHRRFLGGPASDRPCRPSIRPCRNAGVPVGARHCRVACRLCAAVRRLCLLPAVEFRRPWRSRSYRRRPAGASGARSLWRRGLLGGDLPAAPGHLDRFRRSASARHVGPDQGHERAFATHSWRAAPANRSLSACHRPQLQSAFRHRRSTQSKPCSIGATGSLRRRFPRPTGKAR